MPVFYQGREITGALFLAIRDARQYVLTGSILPDSTVYLAPVCGCDDQKWRESGGVIRFIFFMDQGNRTRNRQPFQSFGCFRGQRRNSGPETKQCVNAAFGNFAATDDQNTPASHIHEQREKGSPFFMEAQSSIERFHVC